MKMKTTTKKTTMMTTRPTTATRSELVCELIQDKMFTRRGRERYRLLNIN
jgi:hypothetical protein